MTDVNEPRDSFGKWATLMDRKALGETLNDSDEEFCDSYAVAHPECARELELYAELADLGAAPDEASRALVDGALKRMESDEAERAVAEADTFRRKRVPVFGLVTGALAVAAGVTLYLRAPKHEETHAHTEQNGELPGAQVASISRAELVYASGGVSIAGKPANVGRTLLQQGAVIETADGTACVLIDPDINVCLAEHTRVRLTQLGSPARRLDLESGKAATRLAPQPEGMSFSIAVEDVLSTAVGTAFSVERSTSGVITTVLNGKVRVGRKNDAQIVGAHERTMIAGAGSGAAAKSPVTSVSRSEEAPSWAMLGPTVLWHDPVAAALDVRGEPERAEAWLDEQLIGVAPLSTLVPVGNHRLVVRANGKVLFDRELHMNAGETQAIAFTEPKLMAAAPFDVAQLKLNSHALKTGELAQSAKVLTPEELGLHEEAPAAAAPETAAGLLAQARRLMREGRYAEAEGSYEAIGRAFPGSEEAHTVLVSLGQLELVQLDQPERALSRLDTYLASGGSLSEEARAARIRALRKLGRANDETLAIEEFLTQHPRSFEAAEMRARLAALRATR